MARPVLRPVFADQLTRSLASLADLDPGRDVVLLMEVAGEATHVPHHKKKIAFLFSAMRHFAQALREAGVRVDYVRLDDPANTQHFDGEIARAARRHGAGRVVATHPGDWGVLEAMRGWEAALGIPVEIREDDRFVCTLDAFRAWAKGRKQWRMEHFYRLMRRETGLLMDADGEPEGGQWNFDADNRKALPRDVAVPDVPAVEPDAVTRAVLALVEERFADNFGDLHPFFHAVTARDAEAALEAFVADRLARFGDYQDAMARGHDFLFHSAIALYLNAGLLDPLDVCRRAERAYRDGAAPLNAVEGFIRQILGWREYVRGVYWTLMPGYAEGNFFAAGRDLPGFYWTGETDMACLAAAIGQTKRLAYAHHIQRLMLTGQFAMLIGVRPDRICDWYLAVYADAFDWVELPNTHGMALFADGGRMASKPYAASGRYIDKMSDYCAACRYDVARKTGADACPFNYLYWDFLARNRERLDGNPRLAMVYRTWERFDADRREAIRRDAAAFLERMDEEARTWRKAASG